MFAQKNVALGQSPTAAVAANYIEDVFSTWLWTGTDLTQTINNGIDLSTKGGMVWMKRRDAAGDHGLFDTTRGQFRLISNSTAAQASNTQISSFNTNGFTLSAGGDYNSVFGGVGQTTVGWTFREQAKFFDVVTYTGNGSNNRAISHNLGSTPGCIIVKATSSASTSNRWGVYHRAMDAAPEDYTMYLDLTNAKSLDAADSWGPSGPSSTTFIANRFNDNTVTYVAYLFAHNAGGFGLTGSDNVISCGGFTYNATAGNTVDLGFEPQFVLVKNASATGSWVIQDSMRGMTADNTGNRLFPNSSAAEDTSGYVGVTSTGFKVGASLFTDGNTIIYIAIRRGPMKVPTSGTSVFSPVVYTGTNVDNRLVDMSLLTDMAFVRQRNDTVLGGMVVGDRLRGDPYLLTGTTAAEVSDADSFMTPTSGVGNSWSAMNGFGVGNDATSKLNASTTSNNQIAEGFRRAPGFFDVVCYTGTGSATTFNHNLAAVPELMLVKQRTASPAGTSFTVYSATMGNTGVMFLNSDGGNQGPDTQWNSTTPTASVFSVGTNLEVNGSGSTYVAYLFASCSGVSKVGSYTGTATTLQVDCGFAAGARFVLIKRVGTGDWYVWDSARGIVSGDDPYLLLNSTAAEVTNTDYVDTYSAGFEISSTAPAAINASGGTFIFLAIA